MTSRQARTERHAAERKTRKAEYKRQKAGAALPETASEPEFIWQNPLTEAA